MNHKTAIDLMNWTDVCLTLVNFMHEFNVIEHQLLKNINFEWLSVFDLDCIFSENGF